MGLALCDVERGATVRKIWGLDGKTLPVQPLGVLVDIRYENDPDTLWSANGIKKDAEGKQLIFADFGQGPEQVEARQLALHKQADRRALEELKNRDAEKKAAILENPLKLDRLRVADAAPISPLAVEEATRKKGK